jgi:fatty-acyl-CoA synthase
MLVNFSSYSERLAETFRDREALVNVERGRRYTFGEFHLLTNRIANMLASGLGLGPGDSFFAALKNDNLSLLHLPTIFKGGATALFSNYRDSLEEMEWQVDTAKPRVAFIENELLPTHLDMLNSRGVSVICMDPLAQPLDGVRCFWDLVEVASDRNPDVLIDDREHVAVIRFTGGTTGRGKPVMTTFDNWMALRDSAYALVGCSWTEETRLLHSGPLSHGSAAVVLPTFHAGGCNVTMNDLDLHAYCRTIEAERISAAQAVPTMLYRILDMPGIEEYDLSSLRDIYYGAAPISAAKIEQLQAKFGNIFTQVYGSSECLAFALSLAKSDHIVTDDASRERLASAGRIRPGVEIAIVNEMGKQVGIGETGEIWVRGRGVISGYFNNPEKTAEEFEGGYWKSGDLVRMDESGYIYVVDRKKDMIISGGFNVYAAEVEAAIETHHAVAMCAVVGVPHDEWGEVVHAEVVLRVGSSLEVEDLIEHVKSRLTRYKAPKSISFVDTLPLGSTGKILRRVVRGKYWTESDRLV